MPAVAVAAHHDEIGLVPLHEPRQLVGGLAEAEVELGLHPVVGELRGVELQPLLVVPRLAVAELDAHEPRPARLDHVEQQHLGSPAGGARQRDSMGEDGLVGPGEIDRHGDPSRHARRLDLRHLARPVEADHRLDRRRRASAARPARP